MIPTDCHIFRRGWNHQPDCHVRLHVGLSEVKIQPASMAQVESLRDRKSDLARKVDFEQEHCWHWKMLKHPNQIYWILIYHPYHSLSILSSYYSSWAQKWTSPFFTKMSWFFWQALPVLTSVLISQRLGEFWPQDVREQVETEIARFQGKVTTPAGAVTLGWSSRITGKMVYGTIPSHGW